MPPYTLDSANGDATLGGDDRSHRTFTERFQAFGHELREDVEVIARAP